MARYLGKHTIGIDMRTGKKVRYADLVEDGENRGILTTREERDAEHPQKFARRVPLDRLTIRRPSPEPMIGAVTVIGNSGGSSDLWEGNQTALHLGLIMGEVVVTPSAENRPGSQIAPVITGTPREGETLTTSDGTWSNSPTAYAYQWYRNGTEIPGETANTYDLVFADVGTLITTIVTASNSGGSAAQTSNAVGPILQALPVNTVLPVITGTPQVGETLTVDTGTWDNGPILSYAYQWTSDGANIPGATSSSYLVTTEYAGTELRAVVTATNSGGSSSATADPVEVATHIEVLSNDIVLAGRDVLLRKASKLLVTSKDIAVAGSSVILRNTRKLYVTSRAATVAGSSVTLTYDSFTEMILDSVSGSATGAYSTIRRLRSSYTGSLIRVRRSSDDTEQDIGYGTDDRLDTSALSSFVGANNGAIVTVYDQSGNGRNLGQATTTAQPLIVESGVLNTINSNPTMRFNQSSMFLTNATAISSFITAAAYSATCIARPTAAGIGVFSQATAIWSDTGGYWYGSTQASGGTERFYGGHYDGADRAAVVTTADFPHNAVYTVRRGSGETVRASYNGSGGTEVQGAAAGNVQVTTGTLRVGRNYQSAWYGGYVSELLIFATKLSTADLNTLGANQASLAGVTWTTVT